MTAQSDFNDLLIPGNGYSAQLAAIALDPILPVKAIIAPPEKAVGAETLEGLVGQYAHSHTFLPRLEQEPHRIDPGLLAAMDRQGYRFVPGPCRLGEDAPAGCRRMFATRWQFDAVVETLVNQRVQARHVAATVSGFETADDRLTAVSLAIGAAHNVLIRDLLANGTPQLQHAFSKAVTAERYGFFQKALTGKQAADRVIPYEASPVNRPVKRIKRRLRRLLGRDRPRIIKQLSDSPSL